VIDAKGPASVIPVSFAWLDADIAEPLEELLDDDADLALGKVQAKAEVGAGTECNLARLAVDIDNMRIGKHPRITVGERDRQVYLVALAHRHAVKGEILCHLSVRDHDGK